MTRRVEWAKRALKELARLDRPTQERIVAAVLELASSGRGDVRRLKASAGDAYRLRVGTWRVIFAYQGDASLLVLRVRSRSDAYKD